MSYLLTYFVLESKGKVSCSMTHFVLKSKGKVSYSMTHFVLAPIVRLVEPGIFEHSTFDAFQTKQILLSLEITGLLTRLGVYGTVNKNLSAYKYRASEDCFNIRVTWLKQTCMRHVFGAC